MIRRITAFVAMLLLIVIALLLIWRVYLHSRVGNEETSVVGLNTAEEKIFRTLS